MFAMLNPSDSVADWVVQMVPEMGAGWCPPGMLGVGIGGSAEKAMLLAKESLMEPIDIGELMARGPTNQLEELRLDIYRRVNALGIGAQGLGGLTTVLDVKVLDYPTHAASLPVAVIPNCAATRHIHFTLDGGGRAVLEPPNLDLWPKVEWIAQASARRVSLDGLTRAEIASWKAGERLLLSGKLLTGRDAAHKRICALLDADKPLPEGLNFRGRVIYYVGPVDPVGTEVVGPAGPTTANRMDRFTDTMLGKAGLLAMVGKAERGPDTVASIARHRSAYLIAVGGAAYLVSNAIRGSRIVAFPELGMEAVYEFEVRDMPVTVAVSSDGISVHEAGPKVWAGKFAGIPVAVE
jgi:fumarate hydratase class I